MKKLLSVVIVLCALMSIIQFPVSAATLDNGLMYVIKDGEAIISNYVGKAAEVVIPAEIDGCPVAAIGAGAFKQKRITSVSLPDSIEFIGKESFMGCILLEKINMPKNLKGLGGSAFYNCPSLKTIEFYDSLKTIGAMAFEDCTSLESVKLSNSLLTIEYNTFYIVLPASINKIADKAFYRCDSLFAIFYMGSPKQWEEIGYTPSSRTKVYFPNFENEPEQPIIETIMQEFYKTRCLWRAK